MLGPSTNFLKAFFKIEYNHNTIHTVYLYFYSQIEDQANKKFCNSGLNYPDALQFKVSCNKIWINVLF
jgi:hypothetical protein